MATVITELKIGEALVSLLQPDGSPSPVQRILIAPPGSRVGPITPDERKVMIQTDGVGAKYDEAIDRESAAELLGAKAGEAAAAAARFQGRDRSRQGRRHPSQARRPGRQGRGASRVGHRTCQGLRPMPLRPARRLAWRVKPPSRRLPTR